GVPFDTVIVDVTFASCGLDVMAFLADHHPRTRRLRMIHSTDADLAVAEPLHGTLRHPWTLDGLEALLGCEVSRASAPLRVLFVDDEPAVLAALQSRIRKESRECDTLWLT